MNRRITVLGLGAMGSRIAKRLVDAGFIVTVWNRSKTDTLKLDSIAVKWADTPADAASNADIVLSMVRDDDSSRTVWFGEHGAATTMTANAIAIECSTLSQMYAKEFSERMQQYMIRACEAPIFGSRPQADNGQLICICNADQYLQMLIDDVLAAFSIKRLYCEGVGNPAVIKLLGNTLFAAQVALMSEVNQAISQTGFDLSKALELLSSLPMLSPAAIGAAKMIQAKQFSPLFPIDLVAKDLNYAEQLLNNSNSVLSMITMLYRQAQQHGLGGLNITAIAKLYE